jgi:hypothetical protein
MKNPASFVGKSASTAEFPASTAKKSAVLVNFCFPEGGISDKV